MLDTYLTDWTAMKLIMGLQKSDRNLGSIQVYPDFDSGKLRVKCTPEQSVLLKEKLAGNKPPYALALQP